MSLRISGMLGGMAAVLLLAACGASSGGGGVESAAASQTPATSGGAALRRQGPYLVDGDNRVVILHGVNAVWKLAPYYPPATATGFTAADADFLAANGFNVVRLGVLFAGVMPQPGVIDQNYLDQIDRVVQLLAAKQIWVLLDFHQDMYNEKFQGEGFPDWAVPSQILPNDAKYGFPLNEFLSLALNGVYDRLWADDNALWAQYQNMVAAVATRWSGQPYLLGYDLINEPWPGTLWATCFEIDCPVFDAILRTFQQSALAGVRTADTAHIAFFEPQQLFDFGAPSRMAAVDDAALGLSWHTYCSAELLSSSGLPDLPDCLISEPRSFGNAAAQVAQLGAASLLTEFGASDDLEDIGRVTTLADQHLTGWVYWAYKKFEDPTGGSNESLFSNDGDLTTLKLPKANLLIRPYPQAIAGTPLALSFDTSSKAFSFSYTPGAGTAPTVIFVPALQYPNGYQVSVQGGTVLSAAGATLLQISNTPGATQVLVKLTP
jgi:endoglycosylceramidase